MSTLTNVRQSMANSTQGIGGIVSGVSATIVAATASASVVATEPMTENRAVSFGKAFISAIGETAQESILDWDRFGISITYCCSVYGVTCLLMALILNRTVVLASTNTTRSQQMRIREGIQGRGGVRGVASGTTQWRVHVTKAIKSSTMVTLRIAAILALIYNIWNVLVALDFVKRFTTKNRSGLSDYLIYNPDNFVGTYMATPRDQVQIGPTADLYWPVFLSFCFSQFVETFVSVVTGQKPFNEAGVTLFEHSFAFHSVSSKIGVLYHGSRIYSRPTEPILVYTLFSLFNHLNIHIGGLMNRNKYRLIPSALLGSTFMVYAYKVAAREFNRWGGGILGVYRALSQFPAIIVMAYIPQYLIALVISVCLLIGSLAFLSNGLSLENLNYAGFFQMGGDDDPEFITRNFNVHWTDDFYTFVLNLGTSAISMAGKSCYIKELGIIAVYENTWLENKAIMSKGYGNMIVSPTMKLIEGDGIQESGDLSLNEKSIAKMRINILIKSLHDLFQLGTSLSINAINKILRRRDTIKVIPTFLNKFMVPPDRTSNPEQVYINVDDISDPDTLLQVVINGRLSDIDNSNDYIPEDELEECEESDIENEQDVPFTELISASDFAEDLLHSGQQLRYHMDYDYSEAGILTRSRYQRLANENDTSRAVSSRSSEPELDDSAKLLELLVEKRSNEGAKKSTSDDDYMDTRFDCVVCQVNTREIITWPCKCFAVCEQCRLSLVAKGMEGCVCCRRDVEGVSRIYVP
ncbi:hypothetical protein CAAN3_07S04346 [[Candida] anglica]